jgi:16S rRNA (adenine1518-N6/adenine1519-N6)-dimethyltransferase
MEATPASVMLLKYGLAPSRRRGQNFLVDQNVGRKIVDAVGARSDDIVVEIGSGFGAITIGLAERAGHVVAVELDAGIARAFREEYGELPRVTLLDKDVLDVDLAEIAAAHGGSKIIVAGNLPYNLTSPVIRRLIESKAVVARAILMVQAEVGARIVAHEGERDYSSLSVAVQFHARVRPLFGVKRTCFHPRPRVDSAVVAIDLEHACERRADPDVLSGVVRAAFGQRRKMLRQSLRGVVERAGATIESLEQRSGIDLTRRGETLSVEEFDALALALGAKRSLETRQR